MYKSVRHFGEKRALRKHWRNNRSDLYITEWRIDWYIWFSNGSSAFTDIWGKSGIFAKLIDSSSPLPGRTFLAPTWDLPSLDLSSEVGRQSWQWFSRWVKREATTLISMPKKTEFIDDPKGQMPSQASERDLRSLLTLRLESTFPEGTSLDPVRDRSHRPWIFGWDGWSETHRSWIFGRDGWGLGFANSHCTTNELSRRGKGDLPYRYISG